MVSEEKEIRKRMLKTPEIKLPGISGGGSERIYDSAIGGITVVFI